MPPKIVVQCFLFFLAYICSALTLAQTTSSSPSSNQSSSLSLSSKHSSSFSSKQTSSTSSSISSSSSSSYGSYSSSTSSSYSSTNHSSCYQSSSNNSSNQSSSTSANQLQCSIGNVNAWNTGYVLNVTVTNAGPTPVSAWSVQLQLPENQNLAHGWNAVFTPSGQLLTASNLNWNAQLQPGQSTTFGFQGTHPGNFVPPTCLTGATPVANRAPEANFTVDITGPTVFIDGRSSTDPDGDELSYTLTYGDGKSIRYDNAWHTYRAAGDYTITLTVSDGELSDSYSQTITVTDEIEGNRAPIAMVAFSSVYAQVSGLGQASFDQDGDPLTYIWDLGNGPEISTRPRSTSTFSPTPIYITLTVSDGELGDTVQVLAPAKCGIAYDYSGFAEIIYRVEGSTIYVDARDSTLTTGVEWNFGDGTTSTDLVTEHTYSTPGEYVVSLIARGEFFSGAPKRVTITIKDPSNNTNTPPEACINSFMIAPAPPPLWLNLNANCSQDADGDELTYLWEFGDGTTSTEASLRKDYDLPGVYTTVLTVSDGQATDSSTITNTHGAAGTWAAATCEYEITDESDSDFSGVLRITYNGIGALSSWQVGWAYSGSDRITELQNAELTGNNPYQVTRISTETQIMSGQSGVFEFQGTKEPGTAAEIPEVTGAICVP